MNYELEIAFDFKNSKEYFVRYEPIELTDSEKIPEKLKNKKLYVFEKVKPKAKNIGTFLLEFLNLDFSNALHLNYFLVHYFLVNFIASKKNYLNFEYYKSIDLTSEIMDNPKIILTEDRLYKNKWCDAVQTFALSAMIGMICGFVGAGGGMMMLLVLTSFMGFPLKKAVGTSVFIMTFTALVGAPKAAASSGNR